MKMKNKVLKIILTTVILIGCFNVALYVLGTQGEPYKIAVKFIKENPNVTSRIGSLKSSRLAFFGYSVRYHGPSGHAEYKIFVIGEKGTGTVYLNLEKSAGVWEIRKGNLFLEDGASIPLS